MAFATFLAAFLLLAAPFWEAKPPSQWTDIELQQILADSPWARLMPGPTKTLPPVQMYLVTAGPVRQAEEELARRARIRIAPGKAESYADIDEYHLWVEDLSPAHLILAVRIERVTAFLDASEVQQFQKESVMRIGRRKIKMASFFPPTTSDPWLRIAFPREVQLSDKVLGFDLYIPGVTGGFRSAEFKLGDMQVAGKLEL